MYLPLVDVCERSREIVIFVEMPGVERQDVSIGWKDQILTISGHKRQRPADSSKARYMCVERSYGQF